MDQIALHTIWSFLRVSCKRVKARSHGQCKVDWMRIQSTSLAFTWIRFRSMRIQCALSSIHLRRWIESGLEANWDFSAWVRTFASRQKALGRLVNLRNGHLKHRWRLGSEQPSFLRGAIRVQFATCERSRCALNSLPIRIRSCGDLMRIKSGFHVNAP